MHVFGAWCTQRWHKQGEQEAQKRYIIDGRMTKEVRSWDQQARSSAADVRGDAGRAWRPGGQKIVTTGREARL